MGVTASIGVAPSDPILREGAGALVRAGDEAAYADEARGGDCVVTRSPVEPDPLQASALRAYR